MFKYLIAAIIGFFFGPIVHLIYTGYHFDYVEIIISLLFVVAAWCIFSKDGVAEQLKNIARRKK
jgi:hypothetical protein